MIFNKLMIFETFTCKRSFVAGWYVTLWSLTNQQQRNCQLLKYESKKSKREFVTGWYGSPATDPRFATEYCEFSPFAISKFPQPQTGFHFLSCLITFPSSGWLDLKSCQPSCSWWNFNTLLSLLLDARPNKLNGRHARSDDQVEMITIWGRTPECKDVQTMWG